MSESGRLTRRDIGVLYDCYRSGVISFSQIHRHHFHGRAITTVSNRLGQLVRRGLLRRERITLPLLLGRESGVGVICHVTRPGLKLLGQWYPDEPIREEIYRLNLSTLTHDLILNDVLRALQLRFPSRKIQYGRFFNGHFTKRHPDAVIVGPSGSSMVAIELELTAKSEKRYRDIVLQYQLASEFPKILYVIAGRVISEKIAVQVTQQRRIEGLPPPPTGKFHFVTLTDLLERPHQASMSNGSEELLVH